MSLDPEFFPELSPPPGGVARLRARLIRRRRLRSAGVAAALGTAVLGVLLIVASPPRPSARPSGAPVESLLDGVEHPVLVAWGRRAPPVVPVATASPGVVRLPSSADR